MERVQIKEAWSYSFLPTDHFLDFSLKILSSEYSSCVLETPR
jgi:hypothetical protein